MNINQITIKDMKVINKTGFFFPIDMKFIEEEKQRVNFFVTYVLIDMVYDYFRVMICGKDNTGKLVYTVSKDAYKASIDYVLNAQVAYWGHSWQCDYYCDCYFEWDWLMLTKPKDGGEVYPFGVENAKGFFLRLVSNWGGINSPACVTYNRTHTDR